MDILEQLGDFLRKPFPDMEGRFGLLKLMALISLFVTFFLYIFQPFGISDIEESKFIICAGFGSMTFLGSLLYELTITPILSKLGLRKNWTFGKWLINNFGVTLYISLANFLFIRLYFFGYIQWDLFPSMVYGTFMIGIIPFSIWGGVNLIRSERKYQTIAAEITEKNAKVTAPNKSETKSVFDISTSNIRFVEALQNYIKIGYIDQEGNWKEQVERATLKQFLEQVDGSAIVKCHRSYLVNKEAIEATAGNAQGLVLTLAGSPKEIPVSRSFVPAFR